MATNDDTPLEIELNVGSFTRAERQKLQTRFENDYRTLVRLVAVNFLGRAATGVHDHVTRPNGQRIFADEVFAAMVHIARLRDDPDAKEDDFDDVGFFDLRDAVRLPKGEASPSTLSSEKT